MLGANHRRFTAQNRRAFDDVLELADVSRPPMNEKRRDCVV